MIRYKRVVIILLLAIASLWLGSFTFIEYKNYLNVTSSVVSVYEDKNKKEKSNYVELLSEIASVKAVKINKLQKKDDTCFVIEISGKPDNETILWIKEKLANRQNITLDSLIINKEKNQLNLNISYRVTMWKIVLYMC